MSQRNKQANQYTRSPLGDLIHRVATRGSVRTVRHGNWRQTYVDCGGMCIAVVNGSDMPCGSPDNLELHEVWGENGDKSTGRFQQRVLLCNLHHALIEDRAHQATLILDQYRRSVLADDVDLEIFLAGGVAAWGKKWNLDLGRFGVLLSSGPHVNDIE